MGGYVSVYFITHVILCKNIYVCVQNVGGLLCVQCTLTYLLSSSSREFFLG